MLSNLVAAGAWLILFGGLFYGAFYNNKEER
jgi:hypothetical protein